MDLPNTPESEARAMIERLSTLLDPLGLRVHIVEESKFGKRAHPAGAWGYTRDYMATYAKLSDPNEVIRLFEGLGLHNDTQAARWLLKFDELVP